MRMRERKRASERASRWSDSIDYSRNERTQRHINVSKDPTSRVHVCGCIWRICGRARPETVVIPVLIRLPVKLLSGDRHFVACQPCSGFYTARPTITTRRDHRCYLCYHSTITHTGVAEIRFKRDNHNPCSSSEIIYGQRRRDIVRRVASFACIKRDRHRAQEYVFRDKIESFKRGFVLSRQNRPGSRVSHIFSRKRSRGDEKLTTVIAGIYTRYGRFLLSFRLSPPLPFRLIIFNLILSCTFSARVSVIENFAHHQV